MAMVHLQQSRHLCILPARASEHHGRSTEQTLLTNPRVGGGLPDPPDHIPPVGVPCYRLILSGSQYKMPSVLLPSGARSAFPGRCFPYKVGGATNARLPPDSSIELGATQNQTG